MSNGEIVKPKKMVMARVAQEFNELMGLEPPIDIKAGRDVIIDYVREAAAHLEPDDKLTDETVQALEQLQIPLPGETAEESDESDEPDGEPETESDGWELVYSRNEDKSESDEPEPAEPIAADGYATSEEITEPEPEPEPAQAPQKKASKKKAGKKKAKKKRSTEPKYTRTDAMYQALQEGGYRQDLIARVDALYAEQGGKPNPAGAKSFLDMHLPVLHKFGVVSKSSEGYWSLK